MFSLKGPRPAVELSECPNYQGYDETRFFNNSVETWRSIFFIGSSRRKAMMTSQDTMRVPSSTNMTSFQSDINMTSFINDVDRLVGKKPRDSAASRSAKSSSSSQKTMGRSTPSSQMSPLVNNKKSKTSLNEKQVIEKSICTVVLCW